jgi:DNA replication protein DnaC
LTEYGVRKKKICGAPADAPTLKKVRNTESNTKIECNSWVDLKVQKLPILTPTNAETVRYFGREGTSQSFDKLVDQRKGEQYFNWALQGHPGAGKSNLVWAVADHLANMKQETVLWVSLRLPGGAWTVRLFRPIAESERGEPGGVFEVHGGRLI